MRRNASSVAAAVTHVYLLLLLSVFPLFLGAEGYHTILEVRHGLYLTLTMLWAGVLLVTAAARLLRGETLRWDAADTLIAVAAAAFTVSTIHAPVRVFFPDEYSSDSLLMWLSYCVVLFGARRTAAPRKIYLRVASLSYGACCVLALMQLCGANPFALYPDGLRYWSPEVQELYRFLGTFGNIDVFSAAHCLMLPLLAFCLGRETRRWQLWYLAVLALGLTCAVWAGVSSGLLALGAVGALGLLSVISRLLPNDEKKRTVFVIVTATAGAAAVLLASYFGVLRMGFFSELGAMLHGNFDPSFGSHRVEIWQRTLDVVRQNPIFGAGPGRLAELLQLVYTRFSEVLFVELRMAANNAHNEYLQLLVNFGVLGFVPFALLSILTYVRVLRGKSAEKRLCLAAFFCYGIQAFFNIASGIVVPFLVILWGLLLSDEENATMTFDVFGRREQACSYAAVCDTGMKRQQNQDNLLVASQMRQTAELFRRDGTSPIPALFVVADGMGGEKYGELASELTVKRLSHKPCRNAMDVVVRIKEANDEICALEKRKNEGRIGSTVTALLLTKDEATFVNLGDSRGYRYRSGELTQITRDHTEIQRMIDAGVLTKEAAATHPRRHVLSQHLGIFPEEFVIEPDVFRKDVAAGDIYLLCSDGLTELVTDEEIAGVLGTGSTLSEKVQTLHRIAMRRGGVDNTTIVLVKV